MLLFSCAVCRGSCVFVSWGRTVRQCRLRQVARACSGLRRHVEPNSTAQRSHALSGTVVRVSSVPARLLALGYVAFGERFRCPNFHGAALNIRRFTKTCFI